MFTAHFTLTGETDILFHADNLEAQAELEVWRGRPENKNLSVKGDDRSPPWTWQTYLYADREHVVWPADNIMVGLRAAGARLIIKGSKTYKEVTQSGLLIPAEFLDFRTAAGKQIALADLRSFRDKDYSAHCKEAESLGFRLFAKRATVGSSKHVRVRPRFAAGWKVSGSIEVHAKEVNFAVLKELFDIAGKLGQGDWRPSSKKAPGSFGMFSADIKKA